MTPRVPSRRALIVLGMHRSGTSALAGVLTLLGVRSPAHLMPADSNNPRGYFESAKISAFHDRVLAAAGSHWSDWRPLDLAGIEPGMLADHRAELAVILDQEYDADHDFVVKDPRLCRLLPLWRPVLDELGISPSVVVPVRHPGEVTRSLERRDRDRLTPTHAKLAWLRSVLDAEMSSRGVARVFTRYDALLGDWRGQVERIGDQLAFDWPRSPAEAGDEIDSYLSAGLRHNVSGSTHTPDPAGLDGWVKRTHDAIQALVEDASSEAASAALDAVRDALDSAAVGSTVVADLERDLLADHRLLAGRVADLSDEMEAAAHELVTLERRLNDEIMLLTRRHREAEEALFDRNLELANLSVRVAALERTTRDSEPRLENGSLELRALRAEVTALSELVTGRRWTAEVARRVSPRARLTPISAYDDDRLEVDRLLIRSSKLWNPGWYLRMNPDVKERGVVAAHHYLVHGGHEGRDPGPAFSSSGYLARYPDVAASGVNPLVHYLRKGRREGRSFVPSDVVTREEDRA